MSTRAQIRFVNSEYDRAAQIYNHSDGYPSGIVPALQQLFDVERETGSIRDVHYAAANFIFLRKLQGMSLYLGDRLDGEALLEGIRTYDMSVLEDLDQPHFLLGYGVEEVGRWHGDEEYLYQVDMTPPEPFDENVGEWVVKVSGHNDFPRWDALDEHDGDPWDDVSWQFSGALSLAVEKFTDG